MREIVGHPNVRESLNKILPCASAHLCPACVVPDQPFDRIDQSCDVIGGDEMPRPRISLDIRPARAAAAGVGPESDSRPEPSGAASTPAPEESPAEQVRRLLAAMEARKVPLPKVM